LWIMCLFLIASLEVEELESIFMPQIFFIFNYVLSAAVRWILWCKIKSPHGVRN
jgi:hypothetical protein